MAKKSVTARDNKRARLCAKYKDRRLELRTRSKDINLTPEERMEARVALQKLPRDSNPVRMRARCRLCGRPRSVNRLTGLCRICLRMAVMNGMVPGMRKASW